jgi:hypothetical protein
VRENQGAARESYERKKPIAAEKQWASPFNITQFALREEGSWSPHNSRLIATLASAEGGRDRYQISDIRYQVSDIKPVFLGSFH